MALISFHIEQGSNVCCGTFNVEEAKFEQICGCVWFAFKRHKRRFDNFNVNKDVRLSINLTNEDIVRYEGNILTFFNHTTKNHVSNTISERHNTINVNSGRSAYCAAVSWGK